MRLLSIGTMRIIELARSVAGVAALGAVVMSCGGDKNSSCGGIVGPTRSIDLQPAGLSMFVGETGTVSASLNTSCADDVRTITATSANPQIASVSGSGTFTVTGVSAGTTSITFAGTANTTKNATVEIKAPSIQGVTLDRTAITLRERQTTVLRATVTINGSISRRVTFTSSRAAVATVTAIDSLSATITAVAPGTADIVVASERDPSKTQTARVTVDQALVATVTLSGLGATDSLLVGTTRQLTATAKDETDAVLANRPITWTTRDASVATVSSTGEIRAIARGSAVVEARVPSGSNTPDLTASVTVRVYGSLSIAVSPRGQTLEEGQSATLTATVTATPGLATTLTWESADPTRVSVSASGVVTGLAVGGPIAVRARSTVVAGAVDSAQITIIARSVPTTITLTPPGDTLSPQGTRALSAVVKDQRGTVLATAPITWRSLTPGVATVSASGVVTALANGPARIEAATPGATTGSQLTAIANIEVVAPCTRLRPFTLGDIYQGLFDASSCRNFLGFNGPLDQFALTLAQPAFYSLRLTPTFAASLIPLNIGSSFKGIPPTDTSVIAYVAANAGSYGFMVASGAGGTGAYTITSTLNPDARQACAPTHASRGVSFPSALTPLCTQRDIIVQPRMASNRRIIVTARSQSFAVRVDLRDYNTNVTLASNQAPSPGGTATLNYLSPSGGFVYLRIFGPPAGNDFVTITIDNQ